MTEPDARLSVVVVNWNGRELLGACLRSLVDDAGGRLGRDVEAIVVDNASTDGSAHLVREDFPMVRVVQRTDNAGFAGGANAGIRAARGEIVVLVNNDAVVVPGFLDAMDAALGRPDAGDVAAATGRVLLAGEFRPAVEGDSPGRVLRDAAGAAWTRVGPDEAGMRLVNSTGGLVTRSGNGRDRQWLVPADSPSGPADVFGFNGGCVALRRAALDDVGLFFDDLFMYFEDTELSWRLRRRGWRIEHVPDAVVEHLHAASSGVGSDFFQVHNVRNRIVVAVATAPWPVVVRALLRTTWRLAGGPGRAATARGLTGAVRLLPRALARRRLTDRTALVPRRAVAGWLVPD